MVFQPCRTLHALLIPDATNREPTRLSAAASEDIAAGVVHDAVPGESINVLRRTPPGA